MREWREYKVKAQTYLLGYKVVELRCFHVQANLRINHGKDLLKKSGHDSWAEVPENLCIPDSKKNAFIKHGHMEIVDVDLNLFSFLPPIYGMLGLYCRL